MAAAAAEADALPQRLHERRKKSRGLGKRGRLREQLALAVKRADMKLS